MYVPSFTQIGQNPKEEFEKVGFAYVVLYRKKRAAEVAVSYVRKPSSIQGTYGYKVCECVI